MTPNEPLPKIDTGSIAGRYSKPGPKSRLAGPGIKPYCIAVGIIGGALCGAVFGAYAGIYFPFWGGINTFGEPGSPARDVLARNHLLVFGLLAAVLGGLAGFFIAPKPTDPRSTGLTIAILFTLTFVVAFFGLLFHLARAGAYWDSLGRSAIPPTLDPVRVEKAQQALKSELAEIASGQHIDGPINLRPGENPGDRFPNQ